MKDIYARKQPQEPIQIDKEHGYSFFFDLIRRVWEGYESLAIHRLCTLMRKMDAKWLVEENLELESALSEEIEAIKRRCGKETDCEAKRFTFFGGIPKKDLKSEKASESLLAYVVIVTVRFPQQYYPSKPKKRTYIFEAVVRFPSSSPHQGKTSFFRVPGRKSSCKIRRIVPGFEALTKLINRFFQKDSQCLNRVPVTNYYYHCGGTFETTIGTKHKHTNYVIPGTYFTQQNDLTSVCAHACIQMAINNASVLGVQKITSEAINKSLEIDHTTPKTRVGHFELDTSNGFSEGRSGGLTTPEIIDVVKKLGLGTLFADFRDSNTPECYKWLYPHLESSFPTILGIQRPKHAEDEQVNHVVIVLGHTMNTDRWEPEARSKYREMIVWPYYSTGDWVDHFIINDDNLGMGRTVSAEQLMNTEYRRKQGKLHAAIAISIVPKDVITLGIIAELLASAVIHDLLNAMRGKERLDWQRVLTHHKITCRTFVSTSDMYIKHLSQCEDNFGNKLGARMLKLIREALPHLVWVTEISIPDIVYGNKAKLGDVVGRVDFEYTGELPDDLEAVKFVWLPGVAILGLTSPQELQFPFTGYIPLQRPTYTKHPQMEW